MQRILLCIIVSAILSVDISRADMKAPSSYQTVSRRAKPISVAPLSQQYATLWLKAYRDGARRLLRSKCPFHPTCSAYSQQAIHDQGLCKGLVMTADRLMREADELDRVPHRHVPGRGMCALDPVAANSLDPQKRRQAQR